MTNSPASQAHGFRHSCGVLFPYFPAFMRQTPKEPAKGNPSTGSSNMLLFSTVYFNPAERSLQGVFSAKLIQILTACG